MIATLVRADDFMLCGPKPALYWMEAFIAEHYEIKVVPRMDMGRRMPRTGHSFKLHYTIAGRQHRICVRSSAGREAHI